MTTVTIIGGGIGGTTAAIGLHRAGWRVEVLERATQLETSGAALGLWPTAMKALTALGVGDEVRAAATPQVSGSIRRPTAAGSPPSTRSGCAGGSVIPCTWSPPGPRQHPGRRAPGGHRAARRRG